MSGTKTNRRVYFYDQSWFMPVALVVSFLPFACYLLYFVGSPPALRGTLEEWSQLGGFLSGTTGLALAVLNVLAVFTVARQVDHWGENSAKRSMAATVFTEWDSLAMLTARVRAAALLASMRSTRQPPGWVDNGELVALDFTRVQPHNDNGMTELFLVSAYFERVAVLIRAGYVDPNDVRELLSSNWVWWHHYAFQHWPDSWEVVRVKHREVHKVITGTDKTPTNEKVAKDYSQWLDLAKRQVP